MRGSHGMLTIRPSSPFHVVRTKLKLICCLDELVHVARFAGEECGVLSCM
jgi:hypothetical protein